MRPQTDAEFAKALRLQSCYATDSETQWLMKASADRLEQLAAPQPAGAAKAEAADEAPASEEQNAPVAAKPQRLPRAKAKAAGD